MRFRNIVIMITFYSYLPHPLRRRSLGLMRARSPWNPPDIRRAKIEVLTWRTLSDPRFRRQIGAENRFGLFSAD